MNAENLKKIQNQIAEAVRTAGRPADSVRLLAVSKTFPASDIQTAYDLGQRMFGENRVQELVSKAPVLPGNIEWHLIGHLQSNKAVKAAEYAHWIHSVDSAELVRKLGDAAQRFGKVLNILLETNVTGEESKFGIRSYETLREIAQAALQQKGLSLRGLMTMAEAGASEERLHETFRGLREMRDRLSRELNVSLPELSMGMSADFVQAIQEGATMVRVGSAIFGSR